jgi:hypothetical protein
MTTLWKPYIANCLIWAIGMQLSRGGWVCWRKSHYGWWPHAIWSIDRKLWWEYLPVNFSGRLRWWQVLWIVLFRGQPRAVERGEL